MVRARINEISLASLFGRKQAVRLGVCLRELLIWLGRFWTAENWSRTETREGYVVKIGGNDFVQGQAGVQIDNLNGRIHHIPIQISPSDHKPNYLCKTVC